MTLQARPRPDLAIRASRRLHRPPLPQPPHLHHPLRLKSSTPNTTVYEPRLTRWHRYEGPEVLTKPSLRNPLNYFERERQRLRLNQYHKRRMFGAGVGLGACVLAQILLIFTFGDESAPNKQQSRELERLDARSPREGEAGFPAAEGGVHVVGQKPGVPGVVLDEAGNELVETGNSTIPFFPKVILLPKTAREQTSGALPAAANAAAETGDEAYTLLGHGIRTVSFLRISVYYLGVYVRTADLPELQRRFVSQANENATSLIPAEKAGLRETLLDAERSREVWDAVLRGGGVKSAVRVVPVKNTDFGHLRDGFMNGITSRTREAAARAVREGRAGGAYDDEGFGVAMGEFKRLFGGRGKAATGSVVLLAREGDGALGLSYQRAPSEEEKKLGRAMPWEDLGRIADERIARLVWLGYLGGGNVSSEAARRSVVEGVMELVERPVGTVGVGIA